MLTIKAEAFAGVTIKDTCTQMNELSNRMGCYIELKFNDVTMIAKPNGNPDFGVSEYHRLVESKDIYKIAFF